MQFNDSGSMFELLSHQQLPLMLFTEMYYADICGGETILIHAFVYQPQEETSICVKK